MKKFLNYFFFFSLQTPQFAMINNPASRLAMVSLPALPSLQPLPNLPSEPLVPVRVPQEPLAPGASGDPELIAWLHELNVDTHSIDILVRQQEYTKDDLMEFISREELLNSGLRFV